MRKIISARIAANLAHAVCPRQKNNLDMGKKKNFNRREFIDQGMRLTLLLAVGGVSGLSAINASGKGYVWQIDPYKCTQCGRCATACVKTPSAVKCVHAFDVCGYCDLCGGYLKPGSNARDTGAENQLCPTAAIERKFIEEPYYEYIINEELCIGCAKCVEGCTSFGNGSMQLQIRHDECLNCNECAIARVCPGEAISRVPADQPYMIKGQYNPQT